MQIQKKKKGFFSFFGKYYSAYYGLIKTNYGDLRAK